MIEHNHSWKQIRGYTLGQIGVFLSACHKHDRRKAKDYLRDTWLASNVSGKGLEDLLKPDEVKQKPKEKSQQDVAENWKRLAQVLQGAK